MNTESEMFDIVIAGGGPVGLAFATSLSRLLAGTGTRLAVVERQPAEALSQPAFDGREIAMTHRSEKILRRLGAWERLPADDIHPLREARVRNGLSGHGLHFVPPSREATVLGNLVPNYRIREALYGLAVEAEGVTLMTGASVAGIEDQPPATLVRLEDGRTLCAKLLVAADSRFSRIRDMRGIGASKRDFGKMMMVCRVEHEEPHDETAVEWFGYGQTMAFLPLRGRMSSTVVTLPRPEMEALLAMDEDACSEALTARSHGRLGRMRLASTRHAYPLVAVYADRFVARRFALLGDAAVGMHPVTAHGFNFGLHGQNILAEAVAAAVRRGADPADPGALLQFEREHRKATRSLYLATNATAMLYTTDSPPARLARDAVMACGSLPPVRRAIVAHLMERDREDPDEELQPMASAAR